LGTFFGSASETLGQSLASTGDAILGQLVAVSDALSSLAPTRDILSRILDGVGEFDAIEAQLVESLDEPLEAFEAVDGSLWELATDPDKLADIFNGLVEFQLALAALPMESFLGRVDAQLDKYIAAVETLPLLLESLPRMVQGLSEPDDGFWEALRTFANDLPQWLESVPAAV
jgi:hypothetical protein